MRKLPSRYSKFRLLIAGLITGSQLFAQGPPRFFEEGAVPASNVTAGIWIEGESEPFQVSEGAILTKDGSGNLYVAQGSAVTKYTYSANSGQWEVQWRRNYFANQVSSQQYITAPTIEDPSPPVRHTIIYVEYWLSGPEQSPPRFYQPGKNGQIPPGSNILATYQFVDNDGEISTEIDERDRAFAESPFQARVRAMKTDSAGNLYLAITSIGFRESVLVTKFAPNGDVMWREQTVPNLADGKETLAVDDIRFFELSAAEDQLFVVEAVNDANLPQLNSLSQQSHRRTTFATADDIGPGVRRIHQYGGVATAYRVATSVIPAPGWLNNAPYVCSTPISLARDANDKVFGLFRESDPTAHVAQDGTPPFGVVDDRWVVRAYDKAFQPLEGKVQFFKSHSFIPRTICASGNGEVFVIGDDVDPVSGQTTAQVIRYQYTSSPDPGFTNLWTAEAGEGTSARLAVRTTGEITIAGHNESLPAAWHVARFNDSGNLIWKRSSPGYSSTLQRYRATGTLDSLLVAPDGETHIIGSYSDYDPDFGNSLKSSIPFLSTFANDGDLQQIRLIDDTSLLDSSVSTTSSSETVIPKGTGAILRNDQLVVPALRRRFGVSGEGETDYQAVILAFSNPANANVDSLNITNSTTITVESVNRSFSVPLTTNHPLFRCYGLDPDSPIIAGGSLVGSVYQPTVSGSDLAYGTYQQIIVAEGGQGTSVKTFTIIVKPAAVSITGHPKDQTARKKGSVNLQVFAQGDALQYQWQIKSGTVWKNVPGATQSLLTVSNVTKTATYRCRVFNKVGAEISSEEFTKPAKVSPDTEKPNIAITSPADGKSNSNSTVIKGLVFDNLEAASLVYQIQNSSGKFSAEKEVRLKNGTESRGFSFKIPTAKPGTYTIRLVAKDSSGNMVAKTLEITRAR